MANKTNSKKPTGVRARAAARQRNLAKARRALEEKRCVQMKESIFDTAFFETSEEETSEVEICVCPSEQFAEFPFCFA